MLNFTHKRQALPAYKHKPEMNISFKQINKLNNEANTELKGEKCHISHNFIIKCIQEF